MTTFTAEESKAECQKAMGDKLGAVFYQLRVELFLLYEKWNEYVHLFGEGEDVIKLLNRHGPHFFWMIQETLLEYILLHAARLTDPARTGGYENLSIPLLIELLPDDAVRLKADELANICHEKAAAAREHRNKRIAHKDLAHAMKEAPKPLSPVTRKSISDMLEAFANLLGYLNSHYLDSTYFFKGLGSNGTRTLIYSLKQYERLREIEEKALRGAP